MLFKRRNTISFRERVRIMLWPRRSFSRSARYFMRRAMRLQASPHSIAAGVATGAFSSFTPFIGLHFFLAVVLAWLLRVNPVAAAIGTAIGNPITFPFIWGSTLQIGKLILSTNGSADVSPEQLGSMLFDLEFSKLWQPLLEPMLVGSMVLGLLVAVLMYIITYAGVNAFQKQRRRKIADRASERHRQHDMNDNLYDAELGITANK